jgi:uncharacterized heparinase superfamily protein
LTGQQRGGGLKLLAMTASRLARSASGGLGLVARAPVLRVPGRLALAPQDIRTSDPTVAADIYAGHVTLAGRTVRATGATVFDAHAGSDAFDDELHGFGWLRHLRAAETALAAVNGRAMVADWIEREARQPRGRAARPAVTARRVLSWIAQSPLLLDGADVRFYRRFMRALALDARRLDTFALRSVASEDRLRALVALVAYGIACADLEPQLRGWLRRLSDELDAQVLPDGGHVSRDAGVIVELLLDLLPLRIAFPSRKLAVPEPLSNAIDRMIPMLRMMRHADGALALFNGGGVTHADSIAAVLAHDDLMTLPAENAPHAGYQRVAHGDAVLLMDTGTAPAPPFAGRAHLAPLAVEFSASGQRILVGCGAPAAGLSQLARAARLTAAHTTLVIADSSAGRLARVPLVPELGEQAVGGARTVTVAREGGAEGTRLAASHDGYAAAFGVRHERAVTLAPDGRTLAGRDRLVAAGGRARPLPAPVQLRFHLHPACRAVASEDRLAVYVTLPNREIWRFEAGGMPVAIEESVFLASSAGPRATEQLVVTHAGEGLADIAWTLARTGGGRG